MLKASAWTTLGYITSQAVRLISNLIMTRLLVPEMFGVMAIASTVLYGLTLISDVGIGPNIVHSKRGTQALFLNTAWVVQIRRGCTIFCFAILASLVILILKHAGVVAPDSVYANSQLPTVVATLSFGSIIAGFESTKMFEASRNLAIHRITQIEVATQVAGFLFALSWVIVSHTIWALVAGGLFATLLRTTLSHLVLPGVSNHFQWDPSAFREIIHFGKWIFLSSILGFVVNSGDKIILGAIVSATTLGIYSIAYLISSSLENALSKIIADVSFPALSEVVRERPQELRSAYYRFYGVIAAVAFFVAGILLVAGRSLINLLYDKRYSDAGWMLEILAVSLLAVPFRVAPQCFQALGMPRLLSHIIAVRIIVMFVAMPVGFYVFGLRGALWGLVLSSLCSIPPTVFYARRHNLFEFTKELPAWLSLIGGLIVGELFNVLVRWIES